MAEVPLTGQLGNEFQISPEILALDLDDTLYRTSEAFAAVSALAAREGICTQDILDNARVAKEQNGDTFDLDAFLGELGVPQEEVKGLYDRFGAEQDPARFLYPDALDLIQAIQQGYRSAYILTRGTIERQTAKLLSAGLYNFPHVITDKLIKSELLRDAKDKHGIYAIEARVGIDGLILQARGGTLVEDRPKGLLGLDGAQWNGILVQRGRPEELREAQRGAPPEGSIGLRSLRAITERIRSGSLVGDMVRERLGIQAL